MTARLRALALAFGAIAIVATPRLAAACAVCQGGVGGGTSRAFAIGSLLLSVVPLAVVGAAVFYLRRRARALEIEASARSLATAPRVASRSASSR
jgi:hypothetical protein